MTYALTFFAIPLWIFSLNGKMFDSKAYMDLEMMSVSFKLAIVDFHDSNKKERNADFLQKMW